MRGAWTGRPSGGILGRFTVRFGLYVLAALSCAPARAQPARLALVIGNGAYSASPAIPPLPGCPDAARGVAASLRDLGFEVTERRDAGRGEADAAWVAFARRLRESPGAIGVAYVCGHVATYNGRPFLLPVSAVLERDADVLSQGLLARTVLDAMLRGGVSAGLVALDAYSPAPSGPALQGSGLPGLAETAAAGGVALAVAGPDGPSAPPPLAAALRAELAGPEVTLAGLLAGLRRRVPAAALLTLGAPAAPAVLAGGPVPAPAARVPEAPPVAAVTPLSPAPAAPAREAPPAPASPPPAEMAVARPPAPAAQPAVTLPDEAGMDDADRRRVQGALASIGYYSGRVDGVFGPNTRAAIRRFQFEMGAEMTGVLTGPQATRLVGSR